MTKKLLCALVVLTAVPGLAQEEEDMKVFLQRAPVPAGVPMPPPLPPEPPLAPPAYGIPPELVEKLGLSKSLVQKVQDMTFEANDALINLEAELKRAQLNLERELRQPSPNEATVRDLVEKVGRAETAVRQNRVGLMVAIKKALGPDNWQKLEAEMGHLGPFPRRMRLVAPRPPEAPREREERKR